MRVGEYEKADAALDICISAAEKKPKLYILAGITKAEIDKKDQSTIYANKALEFFEQADFIKINGYRK